MCGRDQEYFSTSYMSAQPHQLSRESRISLVNSLDCPKNQFINHQLIILSLIRCKINVIIVISILNLKLVSTCSCAESYKYARTVGNRGSCTPIAVQYGPLWELNKLSLQYSWSFSKPQNGWPSWEQQLWRQQWWRHTFSKHHVDFSFVIYFYSR